MVDDAFDDIAGEKRQRLVEPRQRGLLVGVGDGVVSRQRLFDALDD